jgi:hypothetical protein
MKLESKRIVIAVLGAAFLASLLFVQAMEVARKHEEAGLTPKRIAVPANAATPRRTRASSRTGRAAPTPRRASAASSAIRRTRRTPTASATTAC